MSARYSCRNCGHVEHVPHIARCSVCGSRYLALHVSPDFIDGLAADPNDPPTLSVWRRLALALGLTR